MNNIAGILKANMNASYQSWHGNLDTAAAVYFMVLRLCLLRVVLKQTIKLAEREEVAVQISWKSPVMTKAEAEWHWQWRIEASPSCKHVNIIHHCQPNVN